MVDGCEFQSLLKHKMVQLDVHQEIVKSLREIRETRGRPVLCYLANMVKQGIRQSISIDYTDDLPFTEMVASVPPAEEAVDFIVVTPGGSAEQVAKFVERLRPRFKDVVFLLPSTAMSAGTIFCLSGNDIIMPPTAFIGPIDPQVPGPDGRYIPAQAILTLIEDIKIRGQARIEKGESPDWTDLQILRQMDSKEIGNALNASRYCIELAENYLATYKFQHWTTHQDGRPVTEAEKKTRASQIAIMLCSHDVWKTHSRGITREAAWNLCKIKVTHAESIPGLNTALRRFWALIYWVFEQTPAYKLFVSDNYGLFRSDPALARKE